MKYCRVITICFIMARKRTVCFECIMKIAIIYIRIKICCNNSHLLWVFVCVFQYRIKNFITFVYSHKNTF